MADPNNSLHHKRRVLAFLNRASTTSAGEQESNNNGNNSNSTLTLILRFLSTDDLLEICEVATSKQIRHNLELDFAGVVCWMGRLRMDLAPLIKYLKTGHCRTVVVGHSPMQVTHGVLSALAQNNHVLSVVLCEETGVAVDSLSLFLKLSKSVTSLYLMLDNIRETHEFSLEDLEPAFASNTTLQELTLRHYIDEEFVLMQILRGAVVHPKLSTLKLYEDDDETPTHFVFNAIRYCMEKSSTIKNVQFFP